MLYVKFMVKNVKKPLFPRFTKDRLLDDVQDSPVVLVHGPRQCGKSTLSQMLPKYDYISFDNEADEHTARSDPSGFVKNLPERIILDEVQRVPRVFLAIKMAVDNKRIYGRFVLTGSSNILRSSRMPDSLAGRMRVLRLHPLSQEELAGKKTSFLDHLFKGRFVSKSLTCSRNQVIDKVLEGGFPEAFAYKTQQRKLSWYQNYVSLIVQRDVKTLAHIRGLDALPKLLSFAANQTAQLINYTKMASDFQLNRSTICDYVALLEQMFFFDRLLPYRGSRLSRLIKTPKLHFSDTGLACALMQVNKERLQTDGPLLGHVLETFVYQELRRMASYHTAWHDFSHYRDKKSVEVDVVIEREGKTVGVEVKASATVYPKDFKPLQKLQKHLGSTFACGVVLYCGERIIGFGKNLYALPISILWTSL